VCTRCVCLFISLVCLLAPFLAPQCPLHVISLPLSSTFLFLFSSVLFVCFFRSFFDVLLVVGGGAENLADRLSDGLAVDAEDAQQLLRLPASGYRSHGHAVHTEARLVDHRRAHRLAQTPWGAHAQETL